MPIHKYRYACMHVCIYITIIIKVDKVVYLRKMRDMEVGVKKICKPSTHKILKNKNEIKSYVLASFISKLTKIKAYYLKMQYELKI